MKKEYILVIDSGIGGLSTLAEIMKQTHANFVYFADVKHAPYGSHLQNELFFMLKNIIKKQLTMRDISMVVLACNTATASSIELLRAEFPNLCFVGTEPAIRLASRKNFKKILCLTTPATSKQDKFLQLKNSLDSKITILTIENLAQNIENFVLTRSILSYVTLLKDIFKLTKVAKTHDCVVLGCTHYVFIADLVTKFAKKPCLDGNFGVAKRVRNRLNEQNFKNLPVSRVLFDCSEPVKSLKENYKKILSQILANLQNVC